MRTLPQGHVGADEDHVPALPFHHPRQHRGGQSVRADEVDLDLRLEVVGAGFVEAAEEGVTGARDEHLDVAEFLLGPVDELLHRVGVGDVQRQRDGFTALGPDLLGQRLAFVDPPGAEGHREAAGGQFGGSGRADAGGGAGDERRPAGGVRVESRHGSVRPSSR